MPRCLVASLTLGLAVFTLEAADAQTTRRPRVAPAALSTLAVNVTDGRGAPLEAVGVTASGPLDREAVTDSRGRAELLNLRAGTYRLRFDAPGWLSFEREVTVATRPAITNVDIRLTPAPPPPVPEPCPPAPPAAPATDDRPVGEVRVTPLADVADRQLIGRGETHTVSVYGCTGFATTRLVQIREPWSRTLADADESIYVMAGEGLLTIEGRQQPLSAGHLAVLPRGTAATISRKGRGPLVLVSVVSGPACDSQQP